MLSSFPSLPRHTPTLQISSGTLLSPLFGLLGSSYFSLKPILPNSPELLQSAGQSASPDELEWLLSLGLSPWGRLWVFFSQSLSHRRLVLKLQAE
jgi:hypothetical protein